MLGKIMPVVASLAIGVSFIGCSAGNDELASSLLMRNSQLENQIATQSSLTAGLLSVLIITACCLGFLLLWSYHRKGASHGQTERQ